MPIRPSTLSAAIVAVTLCAAPATAEPLLSNMRFEGIAIVDSTYIGFADLGRDYTILVDFEGDAAPDRVLLRTRWDDGRVGRLAEAPFEVMRAGPTTGTLVIRTRITEQAMPRSIDWWIEDERGAASNTLVQRLVIR